MAPLIRKPNPADPATVVPVDGIVETQGGPPVPDSGTDLHPVRSAQVLVAPVRIVEPVI
jgi:hypothetical protein